MSDDPKPTKAPALYKHAVRTYELMHSEAEWKELYGEQRLVWTGFFTKLVRSLNLSTPMYTGVKGELERMDCIRQLRRGGGTAPSVWVLMGAPTVEKWNKEVPELPKKNSRKAQDILQEQINQLRERVELLEEAISQRISA